MSSKFLVQRQCVVVDEHRNLKIVRTCSIGKEQLLHLLKPLLIEVDLANIQQKAHQAKGDDCDDNFYRSQVFNLRFCVEYFFHFTDDVVSGIWLLVVRGT